MLYCIHDHHNKGEKMTLRKSTTFDYTNKNFDMDFTNLERLPTNTGIALIDRLNREANEQCESLEVLFVEIACDVIDNPERDATRPYRRKAVKVKKEQEQSLRGVAVLPEDLFDDNGAENDVFEAKDEIEVVPAKNNRHHMGKAGAWALENKDTNINPTWDDSDDFDETDPRYLEILQEIV
tara:strand:+ start:383 stop:925 length:543 start_codon:yes stop_codon:yes gene_type:complete